MDRNSRTAKTKSHEFIKVSRPFSFFELAESKFANQFSIKRILSQARQQGCSTIISEEVNHSIDISEENEDLRIFTPNYNDSTIFRLSFFSSEIDEVSDLEKTPNENFLGYAVIKKDIFINEHNRVRVFESVLRTSRHPNNYIRGAQKWTCSILGHSFFVCGYLYAQQNSKTNVCAHVALRTVIARYLKGGDMSYREMNQLLGKDHIINKASDGLRKDEIVKVIENSGARCFVRSYTEATENTIPFQRLLYGCIESGFPALIIFKTVLNEGALHAIPVFGHTFNEDTWVPNAEGSYFQVGKDTRYIPSESWMSMFIAHDDNFGSNFCIPHKFLSSKRVCLKDSGEVELCKMENEGVVHLIVTLPKEINLLPINAEALGAHFLISLLQNMPTANGNKWFERLKFYAFNNMLILRPILISKIEYLAHLKEIRDWDHNQLKKELTDAFDIFINDEPYWLVELSIPELFPANKRKVGEVLIRANIDYNEKKPFNSFVMARLPSYFALYSNDSHENPNYQFIPSGIIGHVKIYSGIGYV